MTWLGVTDRRAGRFASAGLGDNNQSNPVGPLIERGTLMFEVGTVDGAKPYDLIGISAAAPWRRALSFQSVPGGGIALLHRHGTNITQAAMRWPDDGCAQTTRVTYAWDAPNGWGRLALERPGTGDIRQRHVHLPRPLVADDMRDLMLADPARTLADDVLFAGVSTAIEPLGPMPSIHPDTPVATPGGYRPASDLQRGDTVITDKGETVPVLHAVRHTVPARGSFAPIRLRAPHFGLQRDIVVATEQRLVLRGSEVEYTFGQEAVVVAAKHLINGKGACRHSAASTVDYVQVILPGHDTLIAAGCALESLLIGRIRRDAARLDASILSGIPSRLLPEHACPFYHALSAFEATTLVDQRAA
ncbi:Hint domain-containing protein [Tateyamaria sp. syn59]|uniref:Hint domain-containing protein n=1 Tax=Tateyamaria sp. syn59 TaxID=2576942 RepID=UPI0011BFA914|nr:Hint domain-containing protein [Tateyamaria sp. syn59]